MLDWLPEGRAWKWVIGALAFGVVLFLGDAIGRSAYAVRKYGWKLWLRSLVKMEPEQFRTVGVLVLLVVAVTLVWLRK